MKSIAASQLLDGYLTNTNIFVGNASNVATGVAMSGNATIDKAVIAFNRSVANDGITSAKINHGEMIGADISGTADIT